MANKHNRPSNKKSNWKFSYHIIYRQMKKHFYRSKEKYCFINPIFLLQLLYVLALHILHRQSLVSDSEFLEFACSLEEMLGFIF